MELTAKSLVKQLRYQLDKMGRRKRRYCSLEMLLLATIVAVFLCVASSSPLLPPVNKQQHHNNNNTNRQPTTREYREPAIQQTSIINTTLATNTTRLTATTNCRLFSKQTNDKKSSTTLSPILSSKVNDRPDQSKQKRKGSRLDLTSLFCEDIDDYPSEAIQDSLKDRSFELKQLYNVLNTPLDPNGSLSERLASSRSGEDNDANNNAEENDNAGPRSEAGVETKICSSVTKNLYPKRAKNKDDEWMYIVNEVDFMQVVKAEICDNDGGSCSYLDENLPAGMTSSCKQKYAFKQMLAMHPLKKRMMGDVFRYPSCCSCYVSSPFQLRSILQASDGSSVKSDLQSPLSGYKQTQQTTVKPTDMQQTTTAQVVETVKSDGHQFEIVNNREAKERIATQADEYKSQQRESTSGAENQTAKAIKRTPKS